MEHMIPLPQTLSTEKGKFWDVLYQLRLNSILCDIELSVPCQDEPTRHIFIPAHKLVLVGASSYFEDALAKDDLLDVYSFDGISETDLRTVLDYVYHQKTWAEVTATQEATVAASILGIRRHDLIERTTALFQDHLGNNVMVVPLAAKERKKTKQITKTPRIIIEDVEAEFQKCIEKSSQKEVKMETSETEQESASFPSDTYPQDQEQNSYISLENLLRSGKPMSDVSQVVFDTSEASPSASQLNLLANVSTDSDKSHEQSNYDVAAINYQEAIKNVVPVVQSDENSSQEQMCLESENFVVQLTNTLPSGDTSMQQIDGINVNTDGDKLTEFNVSDGISKEASVVESSVNDVINNTESELKVTYEQTDVTDETAYNALQSSEDENLANKSENLEEQLPINEGKSSVKSKRKRQASTAKFPCQENDCALPEETSPRHNTRRRQFQLPEGLKKSCKKARSVSKKSDKEGNVSESEDIQIKTPKPITKKRVRSRRNKANHPSSDTVNSVVEENTPNLDCKTVSENNPEVINRGEGDVGEIENEEMLTDEGANNNDILSDADVVDNEETLQDGAPEEETTHCKEGNQDFETSSDYQQHMNESHTDAVGQSEPCEMCGKKIPGGPSAMEKHIMNVHHSVKNHQCSVCSTTHTTLKDLRDHKINVHNIEPFHCDQCNSGFKSYEGYKIHMYKMHTNVQPSHMCDICGKVFKMRHELYRHVKYTHMEKASLACTQCPRQFKTRSSLRRHMRTFHSNQRNYICDVCQATFKSVTDMKKHRELHFRKENPLSADRSKPPKKPKAEPRPCKYCGKVFNKKESLLSHEKNVHEEKEKGVSYICGVCNKHFSVQLYLQQHIISTHRPHRFSCPTCDKGFTHRYMLNRHIPRCKGIPVYMKPFKCETCGTAFLNKSNFTRHLQDQEKCRRKMGNTTVDYLVYMKQDEDSLVEEGLGAVTNEETIEASMIIEEAHAANVNANQKEELYEIVKPENKKTQLLQIGDNWVELQQDDNGILQLNSELCEKGKGATVIEVVTGIIDDASVTNVEMDASSIQDVTDGTDDANIANEQGENSLDKNEGTSQSQPLIYQLVSESTS